ncbi:MAG TPA: bifunctional phosphopantothenoylcysteine decarboxylase/phosphopantothenate--cysteine ligase CoaBC [Candidatus Dormibacteraeota bacterium]
MPLEPVSVPEEVRGLRIGLLVSGGVAAYKLADLASALTQAGCPVRVAMSAAATRFVGPATFRGVTGNPVLTGLWIQGPDPEPHVQLGDWAQLLLLAPATANTIAKLAEGRADDVVSATVLAARCPLVLAPAMSDAMWAKPQVQENLARVRGRGALVVEPESGHLASGHSGAGRLATGQKLLDALADAARSRYDLAGRQVVVSAGGTREPIDPVRFISNYSSGKMGYALAAAAAERGARVTLVTSAEHPPHPGITEVRVETAAEMLEGLREAQPGADLLVMAAAVADYRPAQVAQEKIRREASAELGLELERNVDILAELGREPGAERTFRVGFAAEGAELEAKALEKLERKRLDAIVANDVRRRDIAFGSDYNEAVVFLRGGERVELPRMTKRELADRLYDLLLPRLK